MSIDDGSSTETMTSHSLFPRESDVASLYIVNYLKKCRNELVSDVGEIQNIYTLLFHHLVVHFSGIVMLRAYPETYDTKWCFPWTNSQYARNPYVLDYNAIGQLHENRVTATPLKSMQLLSVECGSSLPFGYKQRPLLDKFLKLVAGHSSDPAVFLPNIKFQLESLNTAVRDLCTYFSISNVDAIIENWGNHVGRHVSEENCKTQANGLFIGTRNDFSNRKKAINYLSQGKEVIGFTHGEVSNHIYNEPVYGYSDLTLCSTMVDYGSYTELGQLNRPLFSPKSRLQRNSTVIGSFYRPTKTIYPKNIDSSRVLYVPTMYQENYLYGPFHALSSKEYFGWQLSLADSIPNMVVKNHPKSRSQFRVGLREENKRMEDCVDQYEVFVVDYLATGAVLTLFTEAPVIYFDIGLRNLSKQFLAEIRNRCLLVPINLCLDHKSQIWDGLDTYHKTSRMWSNENLKDYSIATPPTFDFFRALKEVVAARR